jgi:glycosyltransferase involved in cell wall biosynthesis
MSAQRIIALVGRRDEPTDGVADYCEWLGGALAGYGYQLETVRVNWPELGWRDALAELREKARHWRGCWVLLQYTTLAWSRRGFPWRTPEVLSTVRESRAHCGVVYHDFGPFIAGGMVGAARKICHLHVLERLYAQADRAIFTVPVEKVLWLPRLHDKAVHIPVGANCPQPALELSAHSLDPATVAVYCVTTDHRLAQEVSDIGCAVKRARSVVKSVRVVVLGRGSREADAVLRAEFAGSDVEVQTLGLLSPEKVSLTLARVDALLFVRGHISSRRGSAIAGIACGLPVIGYQGVETDWPLTEAGLVLVPEGDREGLSAGLAKVLSDPVLRQSLQERSWRAQSQYFSWSAIAAALVAALRGSVAASIAETGDETPLAAVMKSSGGVQVKR